MVSVASNPCGWRRGWDSNPRYGDTVRLISSPTCDQRTSRKYAPLLGFLFRASRAKCLFRAQLGKFPPTNGQHEYRPLRPEHEALIHGGFSPSRYSRNCPDLASASEGQPLPNSNV
jgi:hypothetical protein